MEWMELCMCYVLYLSDMILHINDHWIYLVIQKFIDSSPTGDLSYITTGQEIYYY